MEQHATAGAVGRHPSSETKLKEQRDLHNNAPLTDADGYSQNCDTSGTKDDAWKNGEVAC